MCGGRQRDPTLRYRELMAARAYQASLGVCSDEDEDDFTGSEREIGSGSGAWVGVFAGGTGIGAEMGLLDFAAGIGEGERGCLGLLAGVGETEESIWGKGITPRFLRFARRPDGEDNTGDGVDAFGKVANEALGVAASSVAEVGMREDTCSVGDESGGGDG